MHGAVFEEHASGLAVGVTLNFGPGGIGSGFHDVAGGEREGVSDGHVTGDVRKEDGIFRGDSVELLARGKGFVGPESLVPPATGDPLAVLVLGDHGSKAL